jgi:hypothetical protein
MSYYLCRRCLYKTKQKIDISRHLNRINKCEKNINALLISDEELNKLSLIKIKITVQQNNNFNEILHKNDENCTQIKELPFENAENCTFFKELHSENVENCTIFKELHSKNNENCTIFKELHSKIDKNEEILNKNENNNIIKDEYCNNLYENNNINNNTNKNNIKCSFCNKLFTRNSSLKRHMKDHCNNKLVIENNTINNISNTNNTSNILNNTNNTLNNTINNIVNINVNIDNKLNKIIPFDNDWDMSKIDNKTKNCLLLSSTKFTQTMEHILENDANMNVLIEKDTNLGFIYKNDIEKFKKMDINDIVDTSMKKLYNHLKQIYNDVKDDNEYKICNDYLENEKNNIEDKYDKYINDEITQKKVQEHILDIYDRFKEKTVTNYKKFIEDDNSKNIDFSY